MATRSVTFGHASRSAPGERVCGDACVLVRREELTLAAVADGAGHGPEAEVAARTLLGALADMVGAPIAELFATCDAVLSRTRGAAASLVYFDDRQKKLTWAGVGNVEAALHTLDASRKKVSRLVPTRGVVGQPPGTQPRVAELPLRAGDTVVLATDGVDPACVDALDVRDEPTPAAERLLEQFAREDDDALVMVVRYLGGDAR